MKDVNDTSLFDALAIASCRHTRKGIAVKDGFVVPYCPSCHTTEYTYPAPEWARTNATSQQVVAQTGANGGTSAPVCNHFAHVALNVAAWGALIVTAGLVWGVAIWLGQR